MTPGQKKRRAIAIAAFFVIALVGSILASFVGFMEWFWPGTTVLLVVLCITLLIMLLMQRDRWLIVGLTAIAIFVILDLAGVTNWFIVPERDGSQSTTTIAADCLNPEQKAFVISTTDTLITPDIKAKAATMKDDDSLCATARAILTRVMAAPAQDVPTATAEADKPIPTSASRCRPINDYPTQFLPELSSSGQWILVEMRLDDGTEYEAVLNTTDAPGGRFIITQPFAGHAWEYGPGCSRSDVDAAAVKRTASEIAGGVNNLGTAPDDVVSRMLHPVGS